MRIHRTNERNRSTKNVTIFAREKKRFRTSSSSHLQSHILRTQKQ